MFSCIFPALEVTSAPRDTQPSAYPQGRKYMNPPKKQWAVRKGRASPELSFTLPRLTDSYLPFNLALFLKVHPEQGPRIPKDQDQIRSCSPRAQTEAMRVRKKTPHLTDKPISSTPNSNHRHRVTTQLLVSALCAGDLFPSPYFNPISAPRIPKSFASAARTQKLWVFCLLDARAN